MKSQKLKFRGMSYSFQSILLGSTAKNYFIGSSLAILQENTRHFSSFSILWKDNRNINFIDNKPIVKYDNADIDKVKILLENKNKSGFISGFSDAESSFSIFVVKNPKLKTGWSVQPAFLINLHVRDLKLLEEIQLFFGVGTIAIKKDKESAIFSIQSIKNITDVVIPFFEQYPLITKKRVDYLLFKRVVDLMIKKEHLTPSGLNKIVAIKASINKGLPDALKAEFTDIVPIPRPAVEIPDNIDPNWISGFAEGEGCLKL